MIMREHLIFHVDIDAFFASVEQLLIPALRQKPVIVGSGVIASCSYEARRMGLKAGMPLHKAKQLCPQAVILKGDSQVYRCFAEHTWDICRQFAPAIETYLDEAYGDATGIYTWKTPADLGTELRKRIIEHTGLSVSVGLGENRMMAKIASSAAKPGGVMHIPPEAAWEYLSPLPVRKLPGVGPKTERILCDMNIFTIGDLRRLSRQTLRGMFQTRGLELYDRCRGHDDRDRRIRDVNTTGQPQAIVRNNPPPTRPPATISRETTFHQPTCDIAHIDGMLFYLLERAMRCARSYRLLAGSLETRIRYDDWRQINATHTFESPTQQDDEAFVAARAMLHRLYRRRVALRHVGVALSKFVPAETAGRLFESPHETRRRELCRAVDDVRDRFGHGALITGASIDLLGKLEQNDYGFILRTPSLTK